jgi:cellulose synthase/poly-beta-1,6-N-acetylglucosamine synthase-like glycosyltransferase
MGINSTVFRTDAVRRVGGFSSWLTAGLDFDLFLKLASANYTGTYIPERLIEYRIHPQQSTGTRVCSIAKSLDSVAMLQRARYEGEAETIRRQKLAFAYRSLSRTYVLDRDFSKARLAIRQAQTIFPNDLMTLAVAGILALPDSIVYDLTCYRFKRKLSSSSGVTATLPAFRGLSDSN